MERAVQSVNLQSGSLRRSLKSPAKSKYNDFVQKFGRRLAEMLKSQGKPKVRPIPDYDKIDPLFPPDTKRGLTFVHYVFMAGLKDEMHTRRPNWNGYGIYVDRNDWRPCYPEVDREASEIASSLATAAGKNFKFIEPGAGLLKRLAYAKELENIVVIVVDPWSMTVPLLQNLASKIDGEPLPNSALLVMWNKSGTGGTPPLEVPSDPHFDTRESRKEYIVTVRSHDEFRQTLESFFNTFREAMIANGKIRSAEEGVPTSQPILLNKG